MLGKLGSKLVFFEKHVISYSCILFIKFNALRSFCTNLLWFFKNQFFPKFQSIEPIFRSIEIAIKNFGQPLFVSIDAWLILDQSKHFWSIEPNIRSIEIRKRVFKKLFFMCSNSFFFKKVFHFFFLHTTRLRLQSNFLLFSFVRFAMFFSSKAS